MAFNERIDSFADIPALEAEKGKIKGILTDITTDIAALSRSARGIFNDFGGGSSLAQVVKNSQAAAAAQKALQQATKDLIATQKVATEVARQATEAKKQETEAGKRNLLDKKAETEAERKNTEAKKQSTIETVANAKAKTEEAKALVIIAKRAEESRKAAEKEAEKVKRSEEAYSKLRTEYNEAARAAQNLGAQQYRLNEELAKMQSQRASNGIFSGYSAGDVTAKKAEISNLAPTLAAAQANAMKLSTALGTIELAVDKGQRKVGQYNEAARGLRDILRDTPAFAYSFGTGIEAISNNIPQLTDGIMKMKEANKVLVANGEKPVSILKTLGKELLSFNGLIAIATAAFTIFAARMSMGGGHLDKAEKALEKYNETLKNIEENQYADAAKESARAKLIIEVAQDTTVAMKTRVDAVQELQKKYPEYLGNLDKEKILNGDIKNALDGITEALFRKAAAQAALDKYQETSKVEYEIYRQQKKALEDVTKAEIDLEKARYRKGRVNDEFAGDVTMQEVALKNMQKELDKITEKRNETRKQMREFLNDAKQFAKELVEPQKDPKGENVSSNISSLLEARKKLLEAERLLQEQQIQQDASAQEGIMNNINNSLNQRLEAHKKYYSDLEAMQVLQINKEKDVAKEEIESNQRKLAEAKAGTIKLTADERKAIEILIQASRVRIKALDEKEQAERIALRVQASEKQAAIIKSDTEKNFRAIETAYQEQKNSEESHYLNDLIKLRDQFDKKEISLKDYQQKAMNMTHLFNMEIENADIQHYKALLQQDNLTADERLQVLRKLGEAIKKLGDETKKAPENLSAWQQFFKIFTGEGNKDSDARGQAITELANMAIELEGQLFDLSNQRYQYEIDQLEHKKTLISDISEKEIAAIQNAFMSDKEKEEKIGDIKAKQAQQTDELNRQELANKRKMAINDKIANVSAIIERGLLAEVSALQYLSNPVTAPLYPYIAGLIAGTSAIATTEALATEIPSYAEGTDDHPGGVARFGEKGAEVVKEPNKAPYLVDKETIGYLPPHTQVLPVSDIVGSASGLMGANLIRGLANGSIVVASDSAPVVNSINSLKSEISEVRTAILNKQEVHFGWRNGELQKSVRKNGSWTKYLNNL